MAKKVTAIPQTKMLASKEKKSRIEKNNRKTLIQLEKRITWAETYVYAIRNYFQQNSVVKIKM